MKKAFLTLTALLMVLSGVAAVSAYEAHVINVTAHVENALEVDVTPVEFGIVFPQEWLTAHRHIKLSESANASKPDDINNPDTWLPGDLLWVEYEIFAEWKLADNETDPVVSDNMGNDYYPWLGECLWVGVGVDGDNTTGMHRVGAPPCGPPGAKKVPGFGDKLDGIIERSLIIGIDVPVFEGFYNPLTDPTPKPSGLDAPSWVIPKFLSDNVTPNPLHEPDGIDLGLDLKIQVVDIVRFPTTKEIPWLD
jgi:hypothetical protein